MLEQEYDNKQNKNKPGNSEFWQLNLIENWMLSISLNSFWAHWIGCQQWLVAAVKVFIDWSDFCLCSLCDHSPCWFFPVVMIHLVSQPSARASWAWSKGDAGCVCVCVSQVCLLLFCFLNLLHFLSSLFCHTHRAIIGIHASTASIC